MGWTRSLLLLVAATTMVRYDAWALPDFGCNDLNYTNAVAERCAELSVRDHSTEAALRAAIIYNNQDKPERTRELLTPFEPTVDARVLSRLAWANSRLGARELALEEYRRAFEISSHQVDTPLRVNIASHYAGELYRASAYEEAVRIVDTMLRTVDLKTLPSWGERDLRLILARSLAHMGDMPAAEAELRRLKSSLGDKPLNTIELMLDARLHVDANELRSADGLLEQAQAAARKDGVRFYEADAQMNRIEIAVKEADWKRVEALSTEAETFQDVFRQDDRRGLAWLRGIAARGEGRLTESLELLQQARALSPPPTELWEIDSDLGLTLKALGRPNEARRALEKSISEVELERSQLADPSAESALLGSRQKPYDALFDLFAEAHDAANALVLLQRGLAGRLESEVAAAARGTGHEVVDALERSAARRRLAEATRALPESEDAPGQDTRFIAFVVTDAQSWAVLDTGGRSQVDHLSLSPQDLCAAMRRFGESFDDEDATRLGDALFSPSRLERLGPRFTVLLPRCARSFPVAALRVGSGRLIDRAIISVAPDVSTSRSRTASAADGGSRLVLADPFGNLPAAREEGLWTGRFTGADVLVGARATGGALLPSGGRLLHFATHTVVDVSGPALVLADEKVSVADILHRHLHANLVVLASCHSGSQLEATAADTLSTAFLRAGSGSVLATLRSVEDGFAFEVVRAFYEAGGIDDPAGALARVQRGLARTEPPARWAAFFIAGSPDSTGAVASRLLRAHFSAP